MSLVRFGGSIAALGAYGIVASRAPMVPRRSERRIFAVVNDRGAHRWLHVPQQWGTPWGLPAVAVVAVAQGRRRDAMAALACLPLVKGIEVATKWLRRRPRPLFVQPTVLRDDAPVDGGSMPSGHAALAACGTVLLMPLVPRPVAVIATAVTGMCAVSRVHQGAHEPLDALAGLLLGVGVGLAATCCLS